MRPLVLCVLVLLLAADVSLASRSREPRRPGLAARAAAFDPAAPKGQSYPGQRPSSDPWLAKLSAGAREFWARRGVTVPEAPLDVASDLRLRDGDAGDPRGRAFRQAVDGDSRVVLEGDWAGRLLAQGRDRKMPVRARRSALKDLAALVYHEYGHVGGLEHSPDGVMADGEAGMRAVPGDAASLVRRLVPRERRLRDRFSGVG